MTETNDYEKAKSECWRLLCDSCIIKGATSDCFHIIFDRAYQLGKAHAQPANGLANERLQVAAMAMQGLLASGDYTAAKIDRVMKLAVLYADALLTQLNKPTNETNSED